MSNEEAVWEEPPPRVRGKGNVDWYAQAELAKSRPGEWLRAPGIHNAAQAYNISTGKLKAFTEGEWEAQSRRIQGDDTAKTHIYLRYLGEKK